MPNEPTIRQLSETLDSMPMSQLIMEILQQDLVSPIRLFRTLEDLGSKVAATILDDGRFFIIVFAPDGSCFLGVGDYVSDPDNAVWTSAAFGGKAAALKFFLAEHTPVSDEEQYLREAVPAALVDALRFEAKHQTEGKIVVPGETGHA